MRAKAARWDDAVLATRPGSRALDVLVPTGVIERRSDDILGEVVPAAWTAERLVTFEGKAGRMLVVKLPSRPVGPDPFTGGFRAEFESAFRTRDGLLVWDLVVRELNLMPVVRGQIDG